MEFRCGAEAHDGKPGDPIDDRLGTGAILEAQGGGQEPQDSGGGAEADPSDQDQLQGHPHQIDFGQGRQTLVLSLELSETGLRPLEVGGRLIALGSDASELFALISIVVAAHLGFGFPLIATVFDFGELAHDRLA